MESVYCDCECSDFNHVVRFEYFDRDGEAYVSVRLNYWDRWYKRVWNALRYVFKRDVAYGHYDVTILREQDYARIHDILDRSALKKRQLRAAGKLPPLPTDNSLPFE